MMRIFPLAVFLLGLIVTTNLTGAQGQITNATETTAEASGVVTTAAEDYFAIDCTVDANCTSKDKNAICDDTKRCRCHVEDGWKRIPEKDRCFYHADYNAPCNENTYCTTANATCSETGSLTSIKTRCLCKGNNIDFVAVKSSDTYKCEKIITKSDNSACAKCIANEGTCYEENGSQKCKCTVSRSGDDCEIIHVHVQCTMTGDFSMRLCYDPHSTLQEGQSVSMYPIGKGTVTECIAAKLTTNTTDNFCAAGSYYLKIPMAKDERDTCGVTEIVTDMYTKRLETTWDINDPTVITGSFAAKTYCKFSHSALQSSGAIYLSRTNGNDRGEYIKPMTYFHALTAQGDMINEAVSVKDLIKLEIGLIPDGTYAALKPTKCTVSSSASPNNPKVTSFVIFEDGCPRSESNGGITNFNFQRVRGNMNVTTKAIRIVKLTDGTTMFFHCIVKLCLTGSEDECMPMSTEECAKSTSTSGGRRRRATEPEKETTLDLAIKIKDESSAGPNGMMGMDPPVFATIIGLLVVLVLVALVVASIVVYKIRVKNNKIGDNVELTNKPQRFALPRVQRNHLRI